MHFDASFTFALEEFQRVKRAARRNHDITGVCKSQSQRPSEARACSGNPDDTG
jgi:hypothetical protein